MCVTFEEEFGEPDDVWDIEEPPDETPFHGIEEPWGFGGPEPPQVDENYGEGEEVVVEEETTSVPPVPVVAPPAPEDVPPPEQPVEPVRRTARGIVKMDLSNDYGGLRWDTVRKSLNAHCKKHICS